MPVDLFHTRQVPALFISLFLIIFIRYLLVAGCYHYLFYKLLRSRVAHRILDDKQLPGQQLRREIYWSAISALIFTLVGIGLFWLWSNGYTRIYLAMEDYPLWYLVLSVPLVLFVQDTYYYWLHRWMHLPKVYRLVHKVHHDSIHTSVFTSFSFHPTETLLQTLILPLLLIFIPLYIYALLFILILMTLSAVINHAGVEVYPSGRWGRWLSRIIIGATHHDQHHRKFRANYGLYFTFWDRWMGTEAKDT
ncbi:MAG: sterol desaturase family protein [Bacteroidetes bacterium]|nr:MAG: sterol desaturase family protein [Bacteroidota bacterium]